MFQFTREIVTSIRRNKLSTLVFCGLLVAWYAGFWTAVASAYDIWIGNEIFNHCLFVVPGALYLIYRQRFFLAQLQPKPNLLLVAPLGLTSFAYILGVFGEIQLLEHLAAFSFLPLAIALCIGVRVALTIAYPLFFFVFAIPTGDQLIPFLQDIAAEWSVFLLKLTGVPVFRNGLYIDIPHGRFLVAEACSGISFTIVSVVFGSLYAHLNYTKLWKKSVFWVVALLVPMVANIFRVYGIILVAHLTDMEHAVGTDHLIYGWFFYCIVLFLLILVGEFGRENISLQPSESSTDSRQKTSSDWILSTFKLPLAIILFFLAAQQIYILAFGVEKSADYQATLAFSWIQSYDNKPPNWQPRILNPDAELAGYLQEGDQKIDVYLAWYSGRTEGELISALNRDYDIEKWNILSRKSIGSDSITGPFSGSVITTPGGQKRVVLSYFLLENFQSSSKLQIKLKQTFDALMGKPKAGGYVAYSLSFDSNNSEAAALALLRTKAEKHHADVLAVLPFEQRQ